MTKVSVIIPVYNTPTDLLSRCIESILTQTIRDLEIFVIDDGSTKDCQEFLEQLKSTPKINLIKQENSGVSIARNSGIKKATGEWIMFVDADDYIEPELIEELLKSTKDSTDIICSACKFKKNSKTLENHFYGENNSFKTFEEKKELYKQLMYGRYKQNHKTYVTAIGVPWAKLYRKNFLLENNLFFDPNLRRMQDNIFNMYAFSKAKEIVYLDKCLYNYNSDHLKKHLNKFYPDYPEKMLKLIEARTKAVTELNLTKDTELKKYYLNEQLRFLGMIIIKSSFNKENKISFLQRCNATKKIVNNSVFAPLWTEKNIRFLNLYSKKNLIFYYFIKIIFVK